MLRFAVIALCAIPGALWAQPLQVSEHTLTNGMKILIHEDHDLPSVAMHFFFKIGSRNERPGTTGLSHFFEHMMFNGAKKYGPKQFDIQMEKNGGSNNGYTTNDFTAYTDWFPPSALELMMDMESDRIRDLAFDAKIIESERGVVASERRTSVENSNMQLLMEHLEATAYMAHPYGWPVIGWMSDIEAWSMRDLQNHFRTGYAPNNCVVVVTGDVRPEEVLRLARKYMESIPKYEPPAPVRTREPRQMGERRVIVRKEAQAPILMAAFHVMEAAAADRPALDLLTAILADGRTSRLRARLVEREQLAVSVNAFAQETIDPGLLVFMARPRAGVELSKLEAALYDELESVRDKGVTAREIEKARNQILTGVYAGMARISGKARLLGEYEVLYGDYRKLFSAAADLAKAGPAEVQRVAKQYLVSGNRTVATLIPAAPAK